MELKVFSVKDVKIGLFNRPFYELNKMAAIRSFETAVKNPGSLLAQYPADFQLFQLGEFSEQTGEFTKQVEYICCGSDLTEVTKNDKSV